MLFFADCGIISIVTDESSLYHKGLFHSDVKGMFSEYEKIEHWH